MLKLTLTIALILAGMMGQAAQAHQLSIDTPIRKLSLQKQLSWYTKNAQHAQYVIAFWKSSGQSWRFDGRHPAGMLIGSISLQFHQRLLTNAKQHIAQIKRKMAAPFYGRPPHFFQWLCIHRGEGSWTDSGDPYWGGLQMDRSFMLSYAPRWLLTKGWANTWTPLQQMWVAEIAYSSGRGFYPWPNTARACGLI